MFSLLTAKQKICTKIIVESSQISNLTLHKEVKCQGSKVAVGDNNAESLESVKGNPVIERGFPAEIRTHPRKRYPLHTDTHRHHKDLHHRGAT